ncbi:MAG: hypothetical protein NTV80_00145, partial [Verrucomicrobia bacterium]|nr:hypothetical protein [Verrucomicrobiota bacterium]
EHKAEVQQARDQALLKPDNEELAAAIAEQQQASEQVAELRAELDSKLVAKNEAIQRNVDIANKAFDVRKKNLSELRSIAQRNVPLNEAQAVLLQNMVPGLSNVKAGDVLNNDQKGLINQVRVGRERQLDQESRQRQAQLRDQHLKAFVPAELQKSFKAANQQLEAAQLKLDQVVEAQPTVVQAVAAEKHYVDSNKLVLAQANMDLANNKLEAAKSNLAAARAADEEAWLGKRTPSAEELAALAQNLGAAEAEFDAAYEANDPERLEAAKSNLTAARAADEAAWFEKKEPTKEELAAVAQNLGAAEQEYKAAAVAHKQAAVALESQQKNIPLSENIIWEPVAPSNNVQPPRVQIGPPPQGSQAVNAPLRTPPRPDLGPPPGRLPDLPVKESVAESMAKSRIQRPTLVRPPGPAPLPPGVAPLEGQQQGDQVQGWQKAKTGATLHQDGEAKPRVQRANSVGKDALKPTPDKKPESPREGPVIGGGRKPSF